MEVKEAGIVMFCSTALLIHLLTTLPMRQTVERFPGPTSKRTISVARYRFSIYLAYDGRGIGMIFGIAPIEPDETGVISSQRLRAKNQHDKWKNPLILALHYKELIDQGKTKAEIARMVGVSRARITQVINLLNLHADIQGYLSNAKHDLDMKPLTERTLREIAAIKDSNRQLRAFQNLIA